MINKIPAGYLALIGRRQLNYEASRVLNQLAAIGVIEEIVGIKPGLSHIIFRDAFESIISSVASNE